ncbi:MAG: hypothetical protein R3C60_10470 [Parvularculaceae bacterium]
MKLLFSIAAMTLAQMTYAFAQEDLVHSDVPLWGYDAENVWPKHFSDESSFGCSHNIKLGDWEYKESDESTGWYRLYNYGVFHCYLMVGDSYDREQLKLAKYEPSILINLGFRSTSDKSMALWAVQMGGRPGSDYILLGSKSDEQPIQSFDVLERSCPENLIRSGPSLDILITRYCAINSQSDLISFAKRMAKRQPIGKLQFVDDTLMIKDNED